MIHEQQLPLSLSLPEHHTFETFEAAGNEEVCTQLKAYVSGGAQLPLIYLWSDASAGKTHLLNACCHLAHDRGMTSAMIPLDANKAFEPDILTGMEQMNLVCLDNVQAVAGQTAWELALFNLFNAIQEQGSRLVVAAKNTPDACAIALADLRSRLGWGLVLHIHQGADEEKRAVLKKLAMNRGLNMPDDVADFLLKRHSRDLPSLKLLVDLLDKSSLSSKRALSIPFVRQLLSRKG